MTVLYMVTTEHAGGADPFRNGVPHFIAAYCTSPHVQKIALMQVHTANQRQIRVWVSVESGGIEIVCLTVEAATAHRWPCTSNGSIPLPPLILELAEGEINLARIVVGCGREAFNGLAGKQHLGKIDAFPLARWRFNSRSTNRPKIVIGIILLCELYCQESAVWTRADEVKVRYFNQSWLTV